MMMMSPTTKKHNIILNCIMQELYNNNIYAFREEIRVQIGDFKCEPDIFIGNNLKWHGEYCISAPEFVLEVLSEGTTPKDTVINVAKFREIGVKEYIIISQDALVILYRLDTEKGMELITDFESNHIKNLKLDFNKIFDKVNEIFEIQNSI